MNTRCFALVLSSVIVLAILISLTGADREKVIADDKTEVAKLRAELAELTESFSKFEKAEKDRVAAISHLSRTSPPVGTVVAFAGDWLPKRGKGPAWTEAELGWALCDGRPMAGDEYAELRAVLGKGTLPDYRNYFLRGKDPTRLVGSVQSDSTKMPTIPFVAGKQTAQPSYKEAFAAQEFVFKTGPDQSASLLRVRNTPVTGDHSHTITGGDTETRPINVAVHWIIKFK
jgi:Phage Tail Collar Domain